jgi:hypothetical protein
MSKKSEFYNLANLYSSEILNEGIVGRTASGAGKGAVGGGLLGGALGAGIGALKGGLPGALGGALGGAAAGAGKGALIGGAANAALGRDDDEEDKDSIEMTLPKSNISSICKALKKALGAEEDSEEEYTDEEDDASEEEAEDSFIDAYNKFGNTEKGTGALLKPLPADAPKDLMSAYKSFGAPNTAPAGSLNYGWVPKAGAATGAATDAATGAVADTATGAATEVAKGMNPWLLGGLAAGGGLLAGKMLSGKKNKEEEEDSFMDAFNKPVNPEKGTGAMLKPISSPASSTTTTAAAAAPSKGIADTVMGDIKSVAGAAKPPSTAAAFSGPIGAGAAGAGAETVKSGIGSTFGDLASKAGEFVSNMHPAAKLGLAAGGGYLASKMMDDDEEEGGNGVSKALEYSRNEISSRLTNALSSLEEFDIKKARAVLKNLINDL